MPVFAQSDISVHLMPVCTVWHLSIHLMPVFAQSDISVHLTPVLVQSDIYLPDACPGAVMSFHQSDNWPCMVWHLSVSLTSVLTWSNISICLIPVSFFFFFFLLHSLMCLSISLMIVFAQGSISPMSDVTPLVWHLSISQTSILLQFNISPSVLTSLHQSDIHHAQSDIFSSFLGLDSVMLDMYVGAAATELV